MVSEYLTRLFSLAGKTALVTGAAGGIGYELAAALTNAGAHTALCDINMDALETVSLEGSYSIHRLDMRDIGGFPQAVRDVSEVNGRIDILVNCAGINKREGITDVSESTYDRIMDINLKGAYFLTQEVAPYMKAQSSGSIINIGSHNTGPVLGGVSVYAMSKCGMVAMTKAMAVEWAVYNIRANCVSPGHIKTALTAPTWEHPERSKYLLDRIALRRPGCPEDLVGVCIFLASEASSYITGCEYRVDGGCVCGGQPWPYDTSF